MAKKSAPTGQEYEQHEIAIKLMPGGMSAEEFEAFCEDVTERGILMPITIYEGKVLDGWHRYRASRKTGKPATYIQYEGKDPAGYVAACNILRRKLSSLQKALVGAQMHLQHAISQRDICRRFSISNTVLTMVLKAIDNRCTAIIKRIENDSDYTRGMLREELEELNIVHANYGRSKAPTEGIDEDDVTYVDTPRQETDVTKLPNSAFDLGRIATDAIPPAGEDVEPLPDVGSRPGHPERRAKSTEAQNMLRRWKALDADDKQTFLQMIWAEAKPLVVGLGLVQNDKPAPWDTKKAEKKTRKAARG